MHKAAFEVPVSSVGKNNIASRPDDRKAAGTNGFSGSWRTKKRVRTAEIADKRQFVTGRRRASAASALPDRRRKEAFLLPETPVGKRAAQSKKRADRSVPDRSALF